MLFHGLWVVHAEDFHDLILQLKYCTEGDGVRDVEVARFGPADGHGGFMARAVLQMIVDFDEPMEIARQNTSIPANV